jgi:hypothetical protein
LNWEGCAAAEPKAVPLEDGEFPAKSSFKRTLACFTHYTVALSGNTLIAVASAVCIHKTACAVSVRLAARVAAELPPADAMLCKRHLLRCYMDQESEEKQNNAYVD